MKTILVTGASGFIGRRLREALLARGHRVIGISRHPQRDDIGVDLTKEVIIDSWIPRLRGVDAVVNAVGIIREQGSQRFQELHTLMPTALFHACVAAGVSRVVQISALGADSGTTEYFCSKARADDALMALPLDWCIVRPSLVYGPGGGSAQLFDMLASLPLVPLPGDGSERIQPIYVDDMIDAVAELTVSTGTVRSIVPIVGPRELSLHDFLDCLRTGMRLPPARFIVIPKPLMRVAAAASDALRIGILGSDTLTMLAAGSVGDPKPVTQRLGRQLRDPLRFIDPGTAVATQQVAKLRWLLPMLRVAVAAVWLWTGIVSLGLYPTENSYALLARTGLTGSLATAALYTAALLDLAFGFGTLVLRGRRWLWRAQLTLMIGYTVIISLWLPEFWLHPYGPLLKNIPFAAAIYLLYTLEEPAWSS
jgi:nucleoside-diphosphate-sugar epimerase